MVGNFNGAAGGIAASCTAIGANRGDSSCNGRASDPPFALPARPRSVERLSRASRSLVGAASLLVGATALLLAGCGDPAAVGAEPEPPPASVVDAPEGAPVEAIRSEP